MGRGYSDIYSVADVKFQSWLSRLAINRDVALSDKPLDLGSGEFGALLHHILIKAHPRFVNYKAIFLEMRYKPHPLLATGKVSPSGKLLCPPLPLASGYRLDKVESQQR